MIDGVQIAGISYTISEKSDEQMKGHIGLADFNNQLISINEKHSQQTKRIAVYHEIIHLLSDTYGLGLTEQQVKIGTHALIAFMSDNPSFTI